MPASPPPCPPPPGPAARSAIRRCGSGRGPRCYATIWSRRPSLSSAACVDSVVGRFSPSSTSLEKQISIPRRSPRWISRPCSGSRWPRSGSCRDLRLRWTSAKPSPSDRGMRGDAGWPGTTRTRGKSGSSITRSPRANPASVTTSPSKRPWPTGGSTARPSPSTMSATRAGSRAFTMQTPLEETKGHAIDDRVVAVPILRAGLGLVGPVLELLPNVTVGYIGLERDERTAIASRYYVKLPPDIRGKAVMILDPMLATGGTAIKAVEIMKEYQPASVRLVCVVAAPEGIQALQAAHPDVQIFAAAEDRQLNGQKYILPGLGDYGDRLFGT